MEFRRICTGHWSDIIGWLTMTSPLLLLNTFARLSCMRDNSSRSWRRFGRMLVLRLIRQSLMRTGSPNQPLSFRWKTPSRHHHL